MSSVRWIDADNVTWLLTRANGYHVQEIHGAGGPSVDTRVLRAPGQHGGTLIHAKQRPRDMTVESYVVTSDELSMGEKRTELTRAFRSRLGMGWLRWARDDGTWEIRAQVSNGPEFLPTRRSASSVWAVQIGLRAPWPNWRVPTANSVTLTGPSDSVAIFNTEGQIDAPFQVVFNGPLTNPRFELANRLIFVELDFDILSGESITVITGPGPPAVVYDDGSGGVPVDAGQYVVAGSDVTMTLPQVGNTGELTADAGTGTAVVTWYTYYEGI